MSLNFDYKLYIISYFLRDDATEEHEREYNNFQDCRKFVNEHLSDFDYFDIFGYYDNGTEGNEITDLF